MKTHRLLFVVISMVGLLSACEETDNETYYSTLGNLKITADSVIIESDKGNRMMVKNSLSSSFKDNDRVIAYFTMAEQPLPKGIDYVINVYNIEKVLVKPVIVYDSTKADSIGNDPIFVNGTWISKNYLNVDFRFYGYNLKHMINLTRNAGIFGADTIQLEIRHNDKNDAPQYTLNGFVSFDLTTIEHPEKDSVVLHVTAKEYGNKVYEKYLTYRY
ncbi:MAG TPA: NigD-like C-terminal domain-containing protein [Bacteroidales bacterium]|nr:NigD-like C-terminal domain-containing protein [Bacteroidales bacterium]